MEDKLKNILAIYANVDIKNIITDENHNQVIGRQGIRYSEELIKLTMKFNIVCKREMLGINNNIIIKRYIINVFENDNLEIKIC